MSDREVQYYEFNDFRLDVKNQQLLKKNSPVAISHKAFQALLVLVSNAGQITEKNFLFDFLWGNTFVEEASLTQIIYLLRKALGQNQKGKTYIETVARRGYVFTAKVKTTYAAENNALRQISNFQTSNNRGLKALPFKREEPDTEVTTTPVLHLELVKNTPPDLLPEESDILLEEKNIGRTEAAAPNSSGAIVKPALSRKNLIRIALIILGVMLIPGALYFYLRPGNRPKTASPQIKSLAILPFTQIGETADNEKLGLGIADAMITQISQLKQIPVRPVSAIYKYTDAPTVDPVAAGRDLNVDAILEGTVQHEGEAVRVSVRLIHSADGKLLWAENFKEKYTNIFALQDSISTQVANSMSVSLNRAETQAALKSATSNVEAYQAYTRGVYFWNKRTNDGLQKAVKNFSRAIELDPNYAAAYAGLADSYNMLAYYGFASFDEMSPKAKTAALKALELDDSVGEAYMALAEVIFVYEGNPSGAKEYLDRAVALAPYNSTAHVRLGWWLAANGELNLTEHEMRLAHEYDPLSPVTNSTLCLTLKYQRKFSEALPFCEKALELDPDSRLIRDSLAFEYLSLGRYDEAIAQLKQINEPEESKFNSVGSIGYVHARAGRTREALETIDKLMPQLEREPKLYVDLALINMALGRKEEGFKWLDKAMKGHYIINLTFLYDTAYDEIRDDPRFLEMARRYKYERLLNILEKRKR